MSTFVKLSDSLGGAIYVDPEQVAAVLQTWGQVPEQEARVAGVRGKVLQRPPKGPTRVDLRSGTSMLVVESPEAVIAMLRGDCSALDLQLPTN